MNEYDLTKLCFCFWKATEGQRQAVLDLMNEKEKEAFLQMYGFFRIQVDKAYHDKIMQEALKQYLESI